MRTKSQRFYQAYTEVIYHKLCTKIFLGSPLTSAKTGNTEHLYFKDNNGKAKIVAAKTAR